MNPQLTFALALASTFSSGSATAQVHDADAKAPTTRHTTLDSILGATVQLDPTWQEKQEARKDGDVAKGAKGKIADLIASAKKGTFEWAIVDFGGGIFGIGSKTVAVPFSSLTQRFDKDQNISFKLGATEEELERLAAFDLDAARKRGLDSSLTAAERSWIALRDPKGARDAVSDKANEAKNAVDKYRNAKSSKPMVLAGKTYIALPQRFVCASELDDPAVYAQNEKFGGINKILVNCDKPCVDFLIIGHGGVAGIGDTSYLVPFSAVDMVCCKDDKDEVVYHIDRTKDQMKQCVQYKKPKHGVLDAAVEREARKKFDMQKESRGK